jgi:hypothetical protein
MESLTVVLTGTQDSHECRFIASEKTMTERNCLTAERLRELLVYDPETGDFYRKISSKRNRIGELAGCAHGKGYWYIRIDRCHISRIA